MPKIAEAEQPAWRSLPKPERIPRHIAVIMDGNGRWARERGQPRTEGHKAGAESVKACAEACGELGVQFLTLYAFSSENWKRPANEVRSLMDLLQQFLEQKTPEMVERNIRLQAIGRLSDLPQNCQAALHTAIEATSQNSGLTLVLALSYGGREEIIDGVRSIVRHVQEGRLDPAMLDPQVFGKHLYTRYYPDPDLLVRTSGEMRVSNFLLWQISYTEMVVTGKYWPDFRQPDLYSAVDEYSRRSRRFGGL
ncbi:MAG TPA: isoprenyl transferase [Verrucomicrobiales bacterium]|nr:isoprenyl transferase [Verrucomicrobiales bacterium]